MASRLRTTTPALLLDAFHFAARTRPSMSRTSTDNLALLRLWPSSRLTGGGPAYRKAGKFPLYEPDDLDEWALAKLSPKVRSSSEFRAPENRPQKKLSAKK